MKQPEVLEERIEIDELVHIVAYDIQNLLDVIHKFTEDNKEIPIEDAWRLKYIAGNAHTRYMAYAKHKGDMG